MQENQNENNKARTSEDIAFLSLHGKKLLIDPEIGLGYLGAYINAINTNTKAFENKKTIELILPNANRIVETGNLHDMKAEQLTTLQKGTIVKLYLNDYMSVNGGLCSMGVQELANNLLSYKDNPNVSGAIIEVNSGGGEATAGQIMYNAVKDFKKPVVAYVLNAGSAAYMAITGAKEIVAAGDLSRVGSIGAFVTLDKNFIAKYKSNFEDIYSTLSGDKNAEIRSYIETGDKTLLQNSLDETVSAFQKMVTDSRTIKKQDSTLAGKMFIASDAKNRGLIDIIGTESLAIKRLQTYIK